MQVAESPAHARHSPSPVRSLCGGTVLPPVADDVVRGHARRPPARGRPCRGGAADRDAPRHLRRGERDHHRAPGGPAAARAPRRDSHAVQPGVRLPRRGAARARRPVEGAHRGRAERLHRAVRRLRPARLRVLAGLGRGGRRRRRDDPLPGRDDRPGSGVGHDVGRSSRRARGEPGPRHGLPEPAVGGTGRHHRRHRSRRQLPRPVRARDPHLVVSRSDRSDADPRLRQAADPGRRARGARRRRADPRRGRGPLRGPAATPRRTRSAPAP